MSREKQIEVLADAIYTNCHACLLKEEAEMIARFVVEEQGYREVIHCKDCIFRENDECKFHSTKGNELICAPNDFCSAGRRKEADNEQREADC